MTPTLTLPPLWLRFATTGGAQAGARCGRPSPTFVAGLLRPTLLDTCGGRLVRRNGRVSCPRCARGPD